MFILGGQVYAVLRGQFTNGLANGISSQRTVGESIITEFFGLQVVNDLEDRLTRRWNDWQGSMSSLPVIRHGMPVLSGRCQTNSKLTNDDRTASLVARNFVMVSLSPLFQS